MPKIANPFAGAPGIIDVKIKSNADIKIRAEWGNYEYNLNDLVPHFEQMIDQLQWYVDNGHSTNPEHTKRDIEGYEQLLELGCHKTMYYFLDIKQRFIQAGRPFADNIAVIEYLKTVREWPVKG